MNQEKGHGLASIRAHYVYLSETEKKVADFVLDSPQELIHSTINQLADRLGVAESTIFRFCKRIGFKGYQAMKIALASEVVTPIKNIHEQILEHDPAEVVTEKVFRSNIKTIEDTLQVVDHGNLQKAVDAMLTANKIEFFGSGGSGIVALDAYHKLLRSGLRVSAAGDTHLQLMSASQLSDRDCAVLISHSGTTKDILQILQTAKEAGAVTIGITNFAKSPLSQGVEIPLFTLSEETDYRSEALSSRIAQLTLIDALYVNLMIRRKEEGQRALRNMRKAISNKRL